MTAQEYVKQQMSALLEMSQYIDERIVKFVMDFTSKYFEKAYEDGQKDAKPNWIPCSEKLPEVFCCYVTNYVLTINKFLCYAVEYYDYREGMFASEKTYGKGSVLYWMPLPEPPQRRGENGTIHPINSTNDKWWQAVCDMKNGEPSTVDKCYVKKEND